MANNRRGCQRAAFLGTLFVLATLSGCERHGVEEPEVAAAKEAVQALLTDPSSAQFRSLKVNSTKAGEASVCGEVNAKNRMGGYGGFQRFYFVVSTNEAELDPLMAGEAPDLYNDPVRGKAWAEFEGRYTENCIGVGLPTLDDSKAAQARAEASFKAIQSR